MLLLLQFIGHPPLFWAWNEQHHTVVLFEVNQLTHASSFFFGNSTQRFFLSFFTGTVFFHFVLSNAAGLIGSHYDTLHLKMIYDMLIQFCNFMDLLGIFLSIFLNKKKLLYFSLIMSLAQIEKNMWVFVKPTEFPFIF